MLPLARLDFRLDMNPVVTCSDASATGGGICQSTGITKAGGMAAAGHLRGEVPEPRGDFTVLSIGLLIDGISALRVALDVVGVPVLGHISVEVNGHAQRSSKHIFQVWCASLTSSPLMRTWLCLGRVASHNVRWWY